MDEIFHLLKPLKDLAENWDIDIASELTGFVDIFDRMSQEIDGPATLNFAQAALMIQNSASVINY
jgi:condensin-2 complex subunit H2